MPTPAFCPPRRASASPANRAAGLALLALALLTACDRDDTASGATRASDGGRAPTPARDSVSRAGLSPAATRALDSGNALLRARRDGEALAQYRIAASAAPGHVAPWFGIGMAARRLGDSVLLDSAARLIRARSTDPDVRSLGSDIPGHGTGRGSPHGTTSRTTVPGHPFLTPGSPHGTVAPERPSPAAPPSDAPR